MAGKYVLITMTKQFEGEIIYLTYLASADTFTYKVDQLVNTNTVCTFYIRDSKQSRSTTSENN